MSRSRTLLAVVVSLLLVALLAGMALAAGGAPTSITSSGAPDGYGYGYGPGDDGGEPFDPCSFAVCRAVAAGRVVDAASGAPLAGATVTLQWRAPGDAWVGVPADALRPTANPLTTDAAGHFTWLVRGTATDQVRAVVTREGYAPATGAARTLRADGALDVALTKLPGPPTPPVTPVPTATDTVAPPPPGVVAAGVPVPPRALAVKAKGCAAKKGMARTRCLRAEQLTKALKACRTQKGAKRKTCEKRARALSACDAKKGKKRAACRAKARAIGKATKKTHR